MSETVRQLLHADELQLKKVRAALEIGRFVIVVADDDIWPAARAELGILPLAEHSLQTGEDVVRMLQSEATTQRGVLFAHVNAAAEDAMEALNLNRDGLQGRTCRFLLRVAGNDAFKRFVRVAPDCYSVRDATAALSSALMPMAIVPEAPIAIDSSLTGAQTEEELFDLANRLSRQRRWKEARQVIDRALDLFRPQLEGEAPPLDLETRARVVQLHSLRAAQSSPIERHRHLERALRILQPAPRQLARLRILVLCRLNDYYGPKLESVGEANRLAPELGFSGDATLQDALAMAFSVSYLAHGDIVGARGALPDLDLTRSFNWLKSYIREEEGVWEEAKRLRRWAAKLAKDAPDQANETTSLASLLIRTGEVEAAVNEVRLFAPEQLDRFNLLSRRIRGEFETLDDIEKAWTAEVDRSVPTTSVFNLIDEDLPFIRQGTRIGLLDSSTMERVGEAIAKVTARRQKSELESDPPWSAIDGYRLRADNSLGTTAEEGAINDAEAGLRLARSRAPETMSLCIRRIACARLRVGAVHGLAVLLDEAAQAAETHHLPGEAARIAGYRLWYATDTGRDVVAAEKALNDAFDRCGSALVKAEVLLRIGRGAKRPDLIRKARSIYHALPWPEREGACLEALGMHEAAKKRYDAFGLKLWSLAVERGTPLDPIDA